MARRRTAITNWVEYLAMRGVSTFMNCFDVQQNLATAAWLGSQFLNISPKRRERAHHNLRLSFPDWPEARIADVAERSVRNMFQIGLVDAVVMPRLVTPTSWPRYLSVGQLSGALQRLIRHEKTIFITGHCGNWELLGYALAVLDYQIGRAHV